MTSIPLPRLPGGAELHPIRLSVTLNLRPTSRATMLLPPGEKAALRDEIELFTPQGSAGIFRVTAVDETPGEGCEVTLRHGACALGDALIPGVGELSGTARSVIAALLSRQTGDPRWTLGDCELPSGQTLTCSYNNTRLLTALGNILDEWPDFGLFFEESGQNRLLHLRRLPTEDACECRLTRNLQSLTVTLDDSDLCTRVYMNDLPAPVDADSKSRWGIVSRHLSANRKLSASVLTTIARHYLSQHSEPYLTVKLDAADLSRATGEAFDRFPVGRMCRVALPEEDAPSGQGRIIRQRVISVAYPDVYGDPERAEVTLANRCLDTADYVGGLMANVRVLYRGLADANGVIRLEADRIELLAQEIQLKASSEVVSALEKRTTLAEIDLDGLKGEILLKANQEVVNLLGERVSKAEIDIRGAQADILLKASRDEVSLLGERMSKAEIDINGARADILLRASREEVGLLRERVSKAEIDINGAEAAISLRASKEDVRLLTDRVSKAEISIDGAQAAIALKASQETLDKLTGRVSTAEATLTVQAGQISTKVSAGGIASAINQTAQSVLIQASKIDLKGYVTADQLSARLADFEDAWSTQLRTDSISCNGITGGEADFDDLACGGLYATELKVGGYDAAWQTASVMTERPSLTPRIFHMTYKDANGINQVVDVVTGISFNRGTLKTINYLGR